MVAKRKGTDVPSPPGPPDTTYVFSRAEDHSLWMKSAYWIDKYKVLFLIAFAIYMALGFDFETPAKAFSRVNRRIDSLAVALDTLSARRQRDQELFGATLKRIDDRLEIVIKLRCVDIAEGRVDPRYAQLVGIDCASFMSGGVQMLTPGSAPRPQAPGTRANPTITSTTPVPNRQPQRQ